MIHWLLFKDVEVGCLSRMIAIKVYPNSNHSLLFLNLLNACPQRKARVDGQFNLIVGSTGRSHFTDVLCVGANALSDI
jgi:hypothetical protein